MRLIATENESNRGVPFRGQSLYCIPDGAGSSTTATDELPNHCTLGPDVYYAKLAVRQLLLL